jgi:hypothetical protein
MTAETQPEVEHVAVHIIIQRFVEHMANQCDRRKGEATNENEYSTWHERGQAFWLVRNYIEDTFNTDENGDYV